MNKELIKSISNKAATYAAHKAPIQDNVVPKEYFEYYDAKFAEMLILECAELCTNFKFTDEGPSEGAAYQRALCEFAIKEHFGLAGKGPISHKVIR